LKYALLPNAPPGHWAWHGRVALAALRGAGISIVQISLTATDGVTQIRAKHRKFRHVQHVKIWTAL